MLDEQASRLRPAAARRWRRSSGGACPGSCRRSEPARRDRPPDSGRQAALCGRARPAGNRCQYTPIDARLAAVVAAASRRAVAVAARPSCIRSTSCPRAILGLRSDHVCRACLVRQGDGSTSPQLLAEGDLPVLRIDQAKDFAQAQAVKHEQQESQIERIRPCRSNELPSFLFRPRPEGCPPPFRQLNQAGSVPGYQFLAQRSGQCAGGCQT